jgi:hypothetical protein
MIWMQEDFQRERKKK